MPQPAADVMIDDVNIGDITFSAVVEPGSHYSESSSIYCFGAHEDKDKDKEIWDAPGRSEYENCGGKVATNFTSEKDNFCV